MNTYRIMITRTCAETAVVELDAEDYAAACDAGLAHDTASMAVFERNDGSEGETYYGDPDSDVVQLAEGLKARHEHDCKECHLLGLMDGKEKYDLYYCRRGLPTVVARHGDDGWEYQSGLRESTLPVLKIGWLMADMAGLTKGEDA